MTGSEPDVDDLDGVASIGRVEGGAEGSGAGDGQDDGLDVIDGEDVLGSGSEDAGVGEEAPEIGVDYTFALGTMPGTKTCVLSFATLEVMLPDVNPVLTLQEMDSPFRQLRIPIGQAEGVAIAYAQRQINTPRPLSHELFAQIMEAHLLQVEVVRITDVQGSSFSGEIVVSGPRGQRTLPCRVSDAIAISLRQTLRVPIVATEDVMARASGTAH